MNALSFFLFHTGRKAAYLNAADATIDQAMFFFSPVWTT